MEAALAEALSAGKIAGLPSTPSTLERLRPTTRWSPTRKSSSPRTWGARPRRRRSRSPSRPLAPRPTSSGAVRSGSPVNMPTLDRAELDEMRLYLDLGRRLGMLHSQMDRGTVKSATLSGTAARSRTRIRGSITASFAAGWMEVGTRGPGQPRQRRDSRQGAWNLDRRREDDGPRRLRHLIQTEVVTEREDSTSPPARLFGKEFVRLIRPRPLSARCPPRRQLAPSSPIARRARA